MGVTVRILLSVKINVNSFRIELVQGTGNGYRGTDVGEFRAPCNVYEHFENEISYLFSRSCNSKFKKNKTRANVPGTIHPRRIRYLYKITFHTSDLTIFWSFRS